MPIIAALLHQQELLINKHLLNLDVAQPTDHCNMFPLPHPLHPRFPLPLSLQEINPQRVL